MEDGLNYKEISVNFAKELRLSEQGEITSLPFIRNTIPTVPLVQEGQTIQGFVFGGTNAEIVTGKVLSDFEIEVTDHKKLLSPTFDTNETFFGFIGEHFNSAASALGINFAFAIKPVTGNHGELDGIFEMRSGKGHDFEGLHGDAVGGEVGNFLQEKFGKEVIVSAANDTICLLVAGLDHHTNRSSLCAGIVGTGYNIGFFLDDATAINLESANFTGYPQTDTGKIVDQQSNNPGNQLYDKELAGGSLYKHFNILIEGKGTAINSTEEMVAIINGDTTEESNIAKFLLRRSASLVAAHFAGLYEFKGRPSQLTMVMQGSLFWKAVNYKEMVEAMMMELGVPNGSVVFKDIEESNTLGALKLLTA